MSKSISSKFENNTYKTNLILQSPIRDLASSLSMANRMIDIQSPIRDLASSLSMANRMIDIQSPIRDLASSLSMANRMIDIQSPIRDLASSLSEFNNVSNVFKTNLIKNKFISIADCLDEMSNEICYYTDTDVEFSDFEKELELMKNISDELRSYSSPIRNLSMEQSYKILTYIMTILVSISGLYLTPEQICIIDLVALSFNLSVSLFDEK